MTPTVLNPLFQTLPHLSFSGAIHKPLEQDLQTFINEQMARPKINLEDYTIVTHTDDEYVVHAAYLNNDASGNHLDQYLTLTEIKNWPNLQATGELTKVWLKNINDALTTFFKVGASLQPPPNTITPNTIT